MENYIALFGVSIENLKNLKHHTSQKKILVLSIIFSKCKNEDEKIFKEEESIEILKILALLDNIEKYQNIYIMAEKNMNQEFRLKKKMK